MALLSALTTHWRAELVAPKSLAMESIAVFTTVASTKTMKVVSDTTARTQYLATLDWGKLPACLEVDIALSKAILVFPPITSQNS